MKKGDYYYLVTAVGGTAGPPTGHMVIVARAKSLAGPWEDDPHNPIVRTTDNSAKSGGRAATPPWSRAPPATGGPSITATKTASTPWAARPCWPR
jgi:hypothetical protein